MFGSAAACLRNPLMCIMFCYNSGNLRVSGRVSHATKPDVNLSQKNEQGTNRNVERSLVHHSDTLPHHCLPFPNPPGRSWEILGDGTRLAIRTETLASLC
jgi:hypothetical protein